jgi:sortase A
LKQDVRGHHRHIHWDRLLLILGVLLLTSAVSLSLYGKLAGRASQRAFERSLAEAAAAAELDADAPRRQPAAWRHREGDLLGMLTMPRLEITATVHEGISEPTLLRGIGHVPGTALPGQRGNVALAAHRDTHFRALRDVVRGDLVRLTTLRGERFYAVFSTEIVRPEDVAALAPTEDSRLTLVTCYPFSYVGRAPKRFIVRATEIDASEAAARGLRPQGHPGPGRTAALASAAAAGGG